MSEGLHAVVCDLSECLYYVKLPDQPSRVFCKHPEIGANPVGSRCPFYRMDWQRKSAELAKRFKRTA